MSLGISFATLVVLVTFYVFQQVDYGFLCMYGVFKDSKMQKSCISHTYLRNDITQKTLLAIQSCLIFCSFIF